MLPMGVPILHSNSTSLSSAPILVSRGNRKIIVRTPARTTTSAFTAGISGLFLILSLVPAIICAIIFWACSCAFCSVVSAPRKGDGRKRSHALSIFHRMSPRLRFVEKDRTKDLRRFGGRQERQNLRENLQAH